jgi:hypothetical protein
MCIPPFPRIPVQLARDCIRLFKDHKKTIFNKFHPQKPEVECVQYTPEVFFDLLTRLTDPSKNYVGFKVYPACYKVGVGGTVPAGLEDNLTLVYMPTTGSTPQNDLTNCLIVYDNKVWSVDVTPANHFVRQWVAHYQTRLPDLNDDGRVVTGRDPFQDTKSLYYELANFGRRSNGDGVIDYVECRMNDTVNKLESVDVLFAGFPATALSEGSGKSIGYQLTLIFSFPPPALRAHEESIFFSFFISSRMRDKEKFFADDDPVDTGNPCPPNVCDPTFP